MNSNNIFIFIKVSLIEYVIDELNKLIPEILNVQTQVSEFYGHLMLADKTGYFLPERYQNNLYWRLPMSLSGTITFKFKEEKNEFTTNSRKLF